MQTVLFDLDGTITEPANGIINSFLYALEQLDEPTPKADSLHWIIGPALRESFGKILSNKEEVAKAIFYYREFYKTKGIFDASVFDGIPSTLQTLHEAGYNLIVCTAKPRPYAIQVLEHFNLAHYFTAIYGPEFDGEMDDKSKLLAKIIQEQKINPLRSCLIGDRLYDAKAAFTNGAIPIGALWGYGGETELTTAGVVHLCTSPSAIPSIVASLSTKKQ